jgi:Domain of unknown function (DUF222)
MLVIVVELRPWGRSGVDVEALVSELAACDFASADRSQLDRCAALSTRLRGWLDGIDVEVGRALEVTTGYGQKTFADAANVSMHTALRVLERGNTLTELPMLGAAMRAGDVGGGHVDAATRALRQVGVDQRAVLAGVIDTLVDVARSAPPHEFERRLRLEVQRFLDDGGMPRFEQQRRSIRFRSWTQRGVGMWRGDLTLDPLRALIIDKRIQDEVDRLFSAGVPQDCPSDPIEKQQYLAALAVASLLEGNGSGSGRPELVVIVDATQVDENGEPTVDWGLPVELPKQVLRDVAARAKTHIVAMWPPADLNLGRTQRLASATQRRALRGIYATCAIPDCPVRFSRTKMHHVWWWEHGGPTDLDNLLPICSRHHHSVHDDGWKLKLLPDRTLEVTLPNGTTLTTGPPCRAP